ncbi:MAG TPA: hypothetical protein GX699_08225 [Firmicutes bacterium]|nr:hypothetical protein [Bacillota bacterium]
MSEVLITAMADLEEETVLETVKELLAAGVPAVAAIDAAGLRAGRKIIIGGGVVNKDVAGYVQADAYTNSAQQAVGICRELIREVQGT